MSTFYILPLLMTSLLALNLLLFVVYIDSEERWRIIPICLATLWWHMGVVGVNQIADLSLAHTVSKYIYAGIMYVPVGLVLMFKPYYRKRAAFVYIHACYVTLVVICLFTDEIVAEAKQTKFGYLAQAGQLHPLFILFIVGCLLSIFSAANSARKHAESELERRHILLLIFLTFTYTLATVDFTQIYNLADFYPIGYIFSTIFLLAMAYAILKHSLFQSRRITSKQIAMTVANTAQMIAHDIQVPFNVLGSVLNELQSGHFEREKVMKQLSRIEHSKTYVDAMLQDLLIFGSERVNKLEEVNLEELFLNCWKQLEIKHGNRFRIETSELIVPSVVADAAKMKRLFTNLLINAIEAVDQNGGKFERIWIKSSEVSRKGRRYIEIVLGNSGSFIAPDDIGNVFTKFNSKGKSSGTGLGLAVVQDVVQSHGGEICSRSGRDTGTEFVFTLPSQNSDRNKKLSLLLPDRA